jgi:hypothetical protein
MNDTNFRAQIKSSARDISIGPKQRSGGLIRAMIG